MSKKQADETFRDGDKQDLKCTTPKALSTNVIEVQTEIPKPGKIWA